MKIIEQFLAGKHGEADCEDGIVITDDFAAVIDGSTSKSARRIDATMTNGRLCMMLLRDMIKRMSAGISLDEFCQQATTLIHNQYLTHPAQRHGGHEAMSSASGATGAAIAPEDRLCASVAIYSRVRREIWLVGDCQCMVDGQPYENSKPAEAKVARRRAGLFESLRAAHPDMVVNGELAHDYARDAIIPLLIKGMAEQNHTYAVVDGFPIYRAGIKVVSLAPHNREVVLASDGYPFLRPTLAESEEALRQQLQSDPFNIHTFQATKGLMRGNLSFDDRAYVRMWNEE